jgi:hypothetical protein
MMKKECDRRNFMKTGLAASAATSIAMQSTDSAAQPAGTEMPCGTIKDLNVSRLICGGNMIIGWAHSRDLIYVPDLMRNYFTDEKVLETFTLCEENGINTFLSDPREKPIRIINRFWDERGGKMQWFAEGHPKVKDLYSNLQLSIDNGASAIYIQGGVADKWVKGGLIDELHKCVEFIKENGLVAGIGGHSLHVPMEIVKAGIEVDFFMKTYHPDNYWSATPEENRIEWNVDGKRFKDHTKDHDNIWCINPEEVRDFMKNNKTPWIAFKTMAAGAVPAHEAFPFAFEGGADFVCVGMCDFHVAENAIIVNKALNDPTLKQKRQRPWCA